MFQPNFRGSSGYGEEFEEAGHGEWGGKMQDDVTDGATWLVEQGIADPERMCLVGHSLEHVDGRKKLLEALGQFLRENIG